MDEFHEYRELSFATFVIIREIRVMVCAGQARLDSDILTNRSPIGKAKLGEKLPRFTWYPR
jgi:hypothetical protein